MFGMGRLRPAHRGTYLATYLYTMCPHHFYAKHPSRGAFMVHLREAFSWCMNLFHILIPYTCSIYLFHILVSMSCWKCLLSYYFTLFPKSWREKGSIFVYRKGYTHEFILTKLLIHWVGQCFQKCLLSHSFTLFPESWREKTTFFVYSWVVYSWELNMFLYSFCKLSYRWQSQIIGYEYAYYTPTIVHVWHGWAGYIPGAHIWPPICVLCGPTISMRSIHLAGAFMLHLREAFTWCMNLFHIRVSMNSLHSHSFTLFPKSWREKGSICNL